MTIDLDTLESLAKAATPGPWEYNSRRKEIWSSDTPIIEAGYYARRNVDYIVAVSPDVVLELIAELRAKNKLLEEIFDDCGDKNGGMCPVCHMYAHKHWCWYPHLAKMLGKPLDGHDERFFALDNALRTAANNIRAREEKK